MRRVVRVSLSLALIGQALLGPAAAAAHSQPGPSLSAEQRAQFNRGDAGFDASFVAGAARMNSGLGLLFNNASCAACHVADGRGLLVVGGGPQRSMALVRVSQVDSLAQRGEALFSTAGCSACHAGSLATGLSDVGALSEQVIYPYSDLLLHDLGPDLADNRPDFEASGSEWRTAPLWGIGLTETVRAGSAGYLHDGRARTLDEAICGMAAKPHQRATGFSMHPLTSALRSSLSYEVCNV